MKLAYNFPYYFCLILDSSLCQSNKMSFGVLFILSLYSVEQFIEDWNYILLRKLVRLTCKKLFVS